MSGGLFGDTSLAGSSGSGSSDTGGSNTGDASGFDKCFGQADYPSYSACVAAGVADGSIDATLLPPY